MLRQAHQVIVLWLNVVQIDKLCLLYLSACSLHQVLHSEIGHDLHIGFFVCLFITLVLLTRQIEVCVKFLRIVDKVHPLFGEVHLPKGRRFSFLLAVVLAALIYLDKNLDKVDKRLVRMVSDTGQHSR